MTLTKQSDLFVQQPGVVLKGSDLSESLWGASDMSLAPPALFSLAANPGCNIAEARLSFAAHALFDNSWISDDGDDDAGNVSEEKCIKQPHSFLCISCTTRSLASMACACGHHVVLSLSTLSPQKRQRQVRTAHRQFSLHSCKCLATPSY